MLFPPVSFALHSRSFSVTRTPNSRNHSYVHYSLSKFTGKWFTNHSNHIHIFTPITRIVATKVCTNMIIIYNPDRFKSVVVSASIANLSTLGIPRCNCNQRGFAQEVSQLWGSIRLRIEKAIVTVIFRKLILQNKKGECNYILMTRVYKIGVGATFSKLNPLSQFMWFGLERV